MPPLAGAQTGRLDEIRKERARLLALRGASPSTKREFFNKSEQKKGPATTQEIENLGGISQNLFSMAGPAGALVKGVSDPGLQRLNALFTKSAIEATPFAREFVPRESRKVLKRLQPETVGESLIVGGTTVAVDLPQILALEGVLAKAFPAILKAPHVARSLFTGTTFGAAKALSEGDVAGAIPRAVSTGATFAAFGAAGDLGANTTKLLPKSFLKGIGPSAARRLINVTSKTGAVVSGAGVGAALSVGAPTEDMVANTILGGTLGVLGGRSKRKAKVTLRPRFPKVKGKQPLQITDQRQDPVIKRIDQLTQEKAQQLRSQVRAQTEQAGKKEAQRKGDKARSPQAKDAARKAQVNLRGAEKYDEIAQMFSEQGDLELARGFSQRAAELRASLPPEHKVKTDIEMAFEKARKPKGPSPKDIVDDEVIRSIANRDAITEVIIKAKEKHIAQAEHRLALLAQEAERTGASEAVKYKLQDPQTKRDIVDSIRKAPGLKGIDLQTTEFVRIAQELDGGVPGVNFVNGPVTKMFTGVLSGSAKADATSRRVMRTFLTDLKSFGFRVNPKTGKINKKESRRFADFVEKEVPDGKPFTEAELAKFAKGEKSLRRILDQYYVELNQFLSASGQSFSRYVNDYLPWIAEIDASRYLTGDGAATARLSSKFERPEHASFKYKNPRGKERPVNRLDAIRSVEDYVNRAEIAKATEGTIQSARFRAEAARALKESATNRQDQSRYDTHAKFFDNFADSLTGMQDRHAIDLALRDHPMGRLLTKINKTWIANALTSFGPFINQVLSVPALAGTEVGLRRAIGGSSKAAAKEFWGMMVRQTSNPAYETFAQKHSLVYNARLHAGEGRVVGGRTNVVGRFFDSLTGNMDRMMVAGAFNTGYRYASTKLGLPHAEAVSYGDVLAARTNAVFNRSLKPQLLQSRAGNIIAPLNTSIFASMNTMFRDGLFNPELPLGTKVSRVGKMFAAAVVIRMALESFRKSPGSVFEDAMLDNIPILGSAARFGGPGVFSTITRFAQGKSPRSKIRGAILLAGPRGSFQLTKTFEGIKATLEDGVVRDKSGRKLYAYDPKELAEVLRAATFSPSGTKAGEEYFDKIFPGIVRGSLRAFDVIE